MTDTLDAMNAENAGYKIGKYRARLEISLTETPELHAQTALALQALKLHESVFQTITGLSLLTVDAEGAKIHPMTEPTLRSILSEVAIFAVNAETRKGTISREVYPPLPIVKALLGAGSWPGIRYLKRIVNFPVIRGDGKILTESGYDAESRLYVDLPPELEEPTIPGTVTAADIEKARGTLFGWLIDFPFETDADRAAAIAVIVTVVFRHLIAGSIPLWLISAPAPGTGKTLIFCIIMLAVIGKLPPIIGEAKDPAELRKAVEAVLIGNPSALLIDNMNSRIDAGFLAGLATATEWSARRLGFSEMVKLDVSALIGLTANNPNLSNEIGRRCLLTRLVPDSERPWLREGFAHPDIRQFTLDHRADILAAVLTLGRGWIQAGRPAPTGKPLGSFEAWFAVVGGILEFSGVPGLLANLDSLMTSADTETQSWAAFVMEWERERGEMLTRTADLVDAALRCEIVEEAAGSRGTQTRLGRALTRMVDRIFIGYRIRRGAVINGVQHWKLEKSGGHVGPVGLSSNPRVKEEKNNMYIGEVENRSPKSSKSTTDGNADPFAELGIF
jgi:hypothetical protein